jgi:hypothetical protein
MTVTGARTPLGRLAVTLLEASSTDMSGKSAWQSLLMMGFVGG